MFFSANEELMTDGMDVTCSADSEVRGAAAETRLLRCHVFGDISTHLSNTEQRKFGRKIGSQLQV